MDAVREWNAIARRIAGIADASSLLSGFLIKGTDTYGATKQLGRDCYSVLMDICSFKEAHATILPSDLCERIEYERKMREPLFEDAMNRGGAAFYAVAPILVALSAEISFYLADQQSTIRSRAERAFQHLQRSLAVDLRLREQWSTAFSGGGETACEGLGSVHLLLHGIHAFKAHSTGARTDLVFGNPIDEGDVARAGNSLVLTEWKVGSDTNAAGQFERAFEQAKEYALSAVAGLELHSQRYLVVVSEVQLSPSSVPPDFSADGVTYRHVNIAISPLAPSKAAAVRATNRNRRKPQ